MVEGRAGVLQLDGFRESSLVSACREVAQVQRQVTTLRQKYILCLLHIYGSRSLGLTGKAEASDSWKEQGTVPHI